MPPWLRPGVPRRSPHPNLNQFPPPADPPSLTYSSRRGNVLVLCTLSIAMICGMVGLVVDLGWAYYRRNVAQSAADSAALAAAYAAQAASSNITCGSHSVVCQVATACPASPSAPPANNMITGCLYAQTNGYVNSGNQTVTMAANTTSPAPAVPNVAVLYWATATITETLSQGFSQVLGNKVAAVAVQSTAAVVQSPVPTCIYALSPTANPALQIGGSNSSLTTSCGVYVDSSASQALTVNGQAHLTAPAISVVGNYQNCNNGQDCFYSPNLPKTSQPSVADPYASLPAPAYSGCNYTNKNVNQGSATLSPGVYCGGITISGNSNVTFGAGTYILNGGGLNINSANVVVTTASGGVTFFNTSNGYSYGPILISGQPSVTLTASNSGTYAGILFFQDRSIVSATQNQINGNTTANITGDMYFPTTPLLISGGSTTGPFTGKIIASTLQISGGAYVSMSGPITGSGSGAYTTLIQ